MRNVFNERRSPLYNVLRYSLGWSEIDGSPRKDTAGKSIRPMLCLFACEANRTSARTVLPAALGLEFIHHFSLIHDDIQDRDEIRHHRPTLWSVWGNPKALVAGNALRTIADSCLWQLVDEGVDSHKALFVSRLLTNAYLDMIEGQYMDIEFEGRSNISISDYIKMISKKTGTLIKCSMHVGALVSEANSETVRAFKNCGRSLGLAFQIKDDELGIWGHEKATGKPTGSDIRRKKNSLPLVYTRLQATGKNRNILEKTYAKETLDAADVNHVLEVMDSVKAKTFSENLMAEYCEKGLQSLADIEVSDKARTEIEELVHFLLVRRY